MEQFLTWEFAPPLRDLETTLFLWSGFAIWIGVIARVPFRSRALRSPWLTLVLGFIGTCLGPFLTRSFFQLDRFDPLGPAGIVSSIVVAGLAIAFFHVFSFLSPRNELDDEGYYERDDEDDDWDEYSREERSGRLRERNVEPERRRSIIRRSEGIRRKSYRDR